MTNTNEWAIQLTDTFGTQADSVEALEALRLQQDFLGGRVIAPSPSNPSWRVQAFFADNPDAVWLPDGCRRVLVPAGQRKALGFAR